MLIENQLYKGEKSSPFLQFVYVEGKMVFLSNLNIFQVCFRLISMRAKKNLMD